MVEEEAIPQLNIEEQTASIQEITATAKKLGALAEELKNKLTEELKDRLTQINENEISI